MAAVNWSRIFQVGFGIVQGYVGWKSSQQPAAPAPNVVPFPVPVAPEPVPAPAPKQDVLSEADMKRLIEDIYYEELRKMPDPVELYEARIKVEKGLIVELREDLRARKQK